MKTLFAALMMFLMVGVAQADVPRCVEKADKQEVAALLLFTQAHAYVIKSHGGLEEIQQKFSEAEDEAGGQALGASFTWLRGEAKCWSLTTYQAESLIKLVGETVKFTEAKKYRREVIKLITDKFGQAEGQKIFSSVSVVMNKLLKHARNL